WRCRQNRTIPNNRKGTQAREYCNYWRTPQPTTEYRDGQTDPGKGGGQKQAPSSPGICAAKTLEENFPNDVGSMTRYRRALVDAQRDDSFLTIGNHQTSGTIGRLESGIPPGGYVSALRAIHRENNRPSCIRLRPYVTNIGY